MTSEKIIEADPDVYIATMAETEFEYPDGFESISAFKNGQAYFIPYDDARSDIILRQGPRFVEGLKALGVMIHPEVTLP